MKYETDYLMQDILGWHWYFGYKSATEVWATSVTSMSNMDDVVATDSHELYDWLKSKDYKGLLRTGIDTVYQIVK